MLENPKIINKIRLQINSLKSWSGEKQKKYLIEGITPFIEDMKKFSFEEKKEVLHYAMRLSKKSHINILAKHFDVNLNDEALQMWSAVNDCYDNTYALEILEKKENWLDYAKERYFFENVLLKASSYYVSEKELKWFEKLMTVIAKKTDLNFWLAEEKTTGLSNLSYIATKYRQWGNVSDEIINIKPNWFKKGFNIYQNQFIVSSDYTNQDIQLIREVLTHFWLQKTEDGKYVFEHSKIDAYFLSKMWLFNPSHFEKNIFNAEEKSKFLIKLLHHESAINDVEALIKVVFQACINDNEVKWHTLNLNQNDIKLLSELKGESIDFIDNLIIKSKLEEELNYKTKTTKIKI